MTLKQGRLIEELRKKTTMGWLEIAEVLNIVEKVLKDGEEKCCEGCEDTCGEDHGCHNSSCSCHTPSPAKVKLPEKIDEVLTLNYLTLKNKLNEVIDYLSDKEKEHGN